MNRSDNTELEQYLAISRAVAGEMDLQNVLNRIAGAVKTNLIDYHHLDVAVVLPGDKSKHFAIETGIETVWNRDGKGQPNARAPVRQVLSGEVGVIVTGNAWEDPRFHFDGADDAPIFQANLRSRIHVALTVHSEVIGVLSFSSPDQDAYDDEDVRIAKNIADLIAPYFYALNMADQARSSALAEGAARGSEQSLRHGAQKLTEAMEAERQRLGMELHDETLAELSSVYRQISRLADEGNADGGELRALTNSISHCTTELRRIIENTRHGVLDLFGLTEAIAAQLDRATQGLQRQVATSVCDETGGLLDRAEYRLQLSVFRIVQEAVTNAVKHSGCSAIEVEIRRVHPDVQIKISNDGRVPPEGWRRSVGGVDNIRVRAALIGAEVTFERDRVGSGSQTIVRVPNSVLVATSAADTDNDADLATEPSPKGAPESGLALEGKGA